MSPFYTPIHATYRRFNENVWRTRCLGLVFFTAAALSFLAYLWQVNTLSTKGFQIKNLEKRITVLKTDIQQLELNLAGEQAVTKLNERIQELQMVKVDKVEYLRPLGSSVALSR